MKRNGNHRANRILGMECETCGRFRGFRRVSLKECIDWRFEIADVGFAISDLRMAVSDFLDPVMK
jgi:hypothetical protein